MCVRVFTDLEWKLLWLPPHSSSLSRPWQMIMATITTILRNPTLQFKVSGHSKLQSLKPIFFLRIPASKSGHSVGFCSRRAKIMTELVKMSAFRGTDREETVGMVREDGFVNGSNGVRSGLVPEGLEATLNRLSKWLVAALFGIVIIWRHDAEALWAAMGAVLNAILSVTLKRVLNQERPVSTLRSDPGMPSSHAQSFFYTVLFAIISMVEWLGVNELTMTVSAIALACGSYLSWLRVSQQLHTISQVVVGAVVGSIFSIFWCWTWDAVVLKVFISYLWVRVIVVLGAAGFCLAFILYVIREWLNDE